MDALSSTIVESECSNIFFKNNVNRDALVEILTRVDPRDIFNCILVSKDWLNVITSPLFQSDYGNRWKMSKPTVVESLRIQSCEMDGTRKFPATSNLGRKIYARDVMPQKSYDIGSYICESPKGDLLLFGRVALDRHDRSPLRLYVCKSISGREPVQLPEPPQLYSRDCYASIIPTVDDDDDKYRVILVHTGYAVKSVQVYSSLTGKWERFGCTCPYRIHLKYVDDGGVEGGAVAGGAENPVIYWKTWSGLAAFNVNGGTIAWIPEPPFKKEKKDNRVYDFNITYGASPDQSQGSLQAVVCSYHRSYTDWHAKQFAIQVWTLDDERDWRLLYKVRKCEIWTGNSTLLTSLFKGFRPDRQCGGGGFVFVSFVPGKRDSILVALEERVFIYHFRTGTLEYVKNLKYDGTNPALTMLDLGNSWPSSPPSLQLPL